MENLSFLRPDSSGEAIYWCWWSSVVGRLYHSHVTDGSQESLMSAQSCDNCTLSEGGKPEATTTMPRLLVQHHTPPAKRMNIPVIEDNDHQNQKEQVALFQEERRERCASSRRRDDVSAASPLSPKWTRHHQLLLRLLVLLLLLCFVLKIVSQHFLMVNDSWTGCFGIVTNNFHFKKRVDLYVLCGCGALRMALPATHVAALQ